MRWKLSKSYLVFLALCILPMAWRLEGTSCEDYLTQRPPKIRIARKFRTSIGPMLVIHASIAPKDLNEHQLVTLVCHLEREYATEEEVLVRLFDNLKAAKNFNDIGEGNSGATHSSFRAEYGFDRHSGDQSLRWRPYSEPRDRDNWTPINIGGLPPHTQPQQKR